MLFVRSLFVNPKERRVLIITLVVVSYDFCNENVVGVAADSRVSVEIPSPLWGIHP